MKLFLAGNYPWKDQGIYDELIKTYKPNILESFYYLQKDPSFYLKTKPFINSFMLDSGAFTYLNQKNKEKPNWEAYVEKYSEFVVNNNIDHFLEMDIDPIVGLNKVEELRDRMERQTGKQCIPVWHIKRGLSYWEKMIDEYKYVAIGGIVTNEIKKSQYPIFLKLIDMARKKGVKVHGLGFTRVNELQKYRFDSIDSTAWLYGNRGGFLYRFNGGNMDKYQAKDSRIKGREAAIHNFTQWLLFQKYLE